MNKTKNKMVNNSQGNITLFFVLGSLIVASISCSGCSENTYIPIYKTVINNITNNITNNQTQDLSGYVTKNTTVRTSGPLFINYPSTSSFIDGGFNLSMNQSNGVVGGWLSAVDWNRFNSSLNSSQIINLLNSSIFSKIYYPNTTSVTGGTNTTGNISLMQFYDGKTYNWSEGVGVNPLDIYINYTGINTTINGIQFRELYSGSTSHDIEFDLWDFSNNIWQSYYTITSQADFNIITVPIDDPYNHVSNGTLLVRIHHIAPGSSSHRFYLDYFWVITNIGIISSSPNLQGFAQYQFMGNSFIGSGDFNTTGNINGNINASNIQNPPWLSSVPYQSSASGFTNTSLTTTTPYNVYIQSSNPTLHINATGGSGTIRVTRSNSASYFSTLAYATNLTDFWSIQMRNDATNNLYIRDNGNSITTLYFVPGSQPKTRVGNASMLIIDANATGMTCNSANEGGVYYDKSTHKGYMCNSTTWNALW